MSDQKSISLAHAGRVLAEDWEFESGNPPGDQPHQVLALLAYMAGEIRRREVLRVDREVSRANRRFYGSLRSYGREGLLSSDINLAIERMEARIREAAENGEDDARAHPEFQDHIIGDVVLPPWGEGVSKASAKRWGDWFARATKLRDDRKRGYLHTGGL